MAEVALTSVTKKPGDFVAVDAIDFKVEEGWFIVLVGMWEKTTLLMVAGLEEVMKDEIRIGDRVVNRVPPKDRDIATVFQNYALYPHKDVYKNMAFGLKLQKVPKLEIRKRVHDTVELEVTGLRTQMWGQPLV